MATGGTSFRPGSQGNLGAMLQNAGNQLYGIVRPFLSPTPYGSNPWSNRNSIQSRPVVNPEFLRPDYSGAGERARRFQEYRLGTDIPGANTDYSTRLSSTATANPAAERAYRQEVSNIAQQAAQNPELQRYAERAAAAAASKDQGKMDAARDIGMQMWAKANPTLAAKVKAGQSGYDAIQRTLGAGQMGSPMNFGFDSSSPLSPTPSVTASSYAGATPAGLPGATPLPSNAFSGMVTTPFSGFNAGQTLTSAPLGIPGIPPTGTYEGATGVQPMGSSLGAAPSMFNPADEKAKALLEAFKNKQFGVQK